MSLQASEHETSSGLVSNAFSTIKPYFNKFLRLVKSNRICIVLLSVTSLLFFLFNPLMWWFGFLEMKDPHIHSDLTLDTPGCKTPYFDPYDDTVKHLIEQKKPFVCIGNPVFMITMPNSTIILNDTVLTKAYNISPQNISCSYRAIYREKPTKSKTREMDFTYGKPTLLRFGIPLGEEFIEIQCKLGSKNFTQYIALAPMKPKVEERVSKLEITTPNSLNVILIGIDSVSKLNFLRHFKRTRNFLTSNVSSLEMKGYTKVGENTFPNLVPLLTGHFVDYYWNDSLKNKMFFDNLDFIWKAYSKNGYRTFYAEDSPRFGTFQYMKRGFENPPTDYYYRPMALALDKSDLRKKGKSFYCLNDQLEINMIYGYLKNFVNTMQDRSYFAFAMVSTLTHDYLNYAGYADEPTFKLLEELWLSGAMNRSVTVLFSDHGLRFGKIRETYVGKFEERMPFMYLIFPEWFMNEHENISKALKINQNRLITLFDIHATLYHLLNLTKPVSDELKSNITPKGLSLLNEISEYRTCDMANILPHWCPCQVYQYVAPYDKAAIKASIALINDINSQLQPYIIENICAQLEIEELTDAKLGRANDIVLRFVQRKNDANHFVVSENKLNSLNDYLITIKVRPGGGLFEGTVRHDTKYDTFKVLGISRINMYGKQSWCINNQILKKFCFCP